MTRKWYRHFIQIVLCTAQAYGTTAFFIEAWKQGWKYISPDPFDFWIEFTALNGTIPGFVLLLGLFAEKISEILILIFFAVCCVALWIVIPLLMMWQSLRAMRKVKMD